MANSFGEMPEWLNGTVSKTVVWAAVPRVHYNFEYKSVTTLSL